MSIEKMNFKRWVHKVLPAVYDESLSYYELLCKVIAKLNETIDLSNGTAEGLKELQDYVANYFEDLDVQEEINNKLDEMAESGELTDIIAQYLQLAGVLAYDTKTAMKSAENLVNGSIAKTLGNTTYKDGQGSFYKIRQIQNTDVVDDNNIIALSDPDLVAEKIVDYNANDPTNPCYYGADPTGTYDSSVAIQKCLDANIEKQITFTCGTYLVNTPIEVSYNNKYGGIDFNNSTIINTTENDFVLGIGTKDHALDHSNCSVTTLCFYNIKNLQMDCVSTYAIFIDRWFKETRIDNINILTTKNGIQIGKIYAGYSNTPSDVQMTNFMITNKDMTQNYVGINIIGTDNKFNDGRINGFKTGIDCNGNLIHIDNVHFLGCNLGETNLDNNYICMKNTGDVFANMCYCDSYPCFIKPKSDITLWSINVTNLFIFSWHNQYTESSIFDFSDIINNVGGYNINYKNIIFRKANYPASTKIIELSSTIDNHSIIESFNSCGNIRAFGITDMDCKTNDLSLSMDKEFNNNYSQAGKLIGFQWVL